MTTSDQIHIATGATKPEFLPVPRPGHLCPVTGLGRSYIYQLISEGKIRSVSLRERGKVRGKRLIVADSLLDYLRANIVDGGKAGAA